MCVCVCLLTKQSHTLSRLYYEEKENSVELFLHTQELHLKQLLALTVTTVVSHHLWTLSVSSLLGRHAAFIIIYQLYISTPDVMC